MKPSIFVDLNTVLSHQSSQITSVADYEINWISRGQELLYLPWRQPNQHELEHCPGEKVTALLQKASRALWKIHEAKIKITHTHTHLFHLLWNAVWLTVEVESLLTSLPTLCEQRFDETERWNFIAQARDGIGRETVSPSSLQQVWDTAGRTFPLFGEKSSPFSHSLFWQH